jgi:G3E family GTPase
MMNNLPALSRQIEAADLILVNKSDLADNAALTSFEAVIRERNPEAVLLRTVRGKIEAGVLAGAASAHRRGDIESCNLPTNRPGTFQLESEELSRDVLEAFLHDHLNLTWRIKGWIKADGQWWYVSDNAGALEWTKDELPEGMLPGLTVITPPEGAEIFAEAWRAFGSRR